MAVIYSPGLKKINHSFGVLLWDLLLPKELRERRFYSVVSEHSETVPCTGKLRLYSNTAEALLTDTLESGKLYIRPPSQNPDYFNSRTNSVFLHSLKRPALVTDTFFASQGCPLTRAFTVNVLWHSSSLCLFQSYIKEPFRVRREALRSSFTEVEGVSNIKNKYF